MPAVDPASHLFTVISRGTKLREAFSSCFYKDTNPIYEDRLFQKTVPLNNITLGVRISTREFVGQGGDTDIQSISEGDV